MKVGDIVLAKVTGITDYGFFVEVGNYTGLCHISEVSNNFVEDISKFVSVNEEVYVLVLGIDEKRLHLNVSIKDIYYLKEDEVDRIKETRKGFLPLKKMLPVWVEEKLKEYEKEPK